MNCTTWQLWIQWRVEARRSAASTRPVIRMTALLEKLRDALAREAEVSLALLFGSVARGSATDGSDVDLAVRVADDAELPALASRLSAAVGREVDLISLRDPGVPMLEELLRDAIVVHEGEYGAAARWRSHAWLDRELDLPWYHRMRDAWLKQLAQGGRSDGQP
jgi:predicted nucleotidyltransferase